MHFQQAFNCLPGGVAEGDMTEIQLHMPLL